MMVTALACKASIWAWQKSVFTATTSNMIQMDRSISISKAGPSAGYSTWWESKQVQVDYSFLDTIITLFITKWWISQLSADHLSIIVIPGVMTNSAPMSSWAYLHSTSTRANTHSLNQPDITVVANSCCLKKLHKNINQCHSNQSGHSSLGHYILTYLHSYQIKTQI